MKALLSSSFTQQPHDHMNVWEEGGQMLVRMDCDTRVTLEVPLKGGGQGRISEKAILFFEEVWMSLSPPLGSPAPQAHIYSSKKQLRGRRVLWGLRLLRKGFVGEIGNSARPQVLSRTGKEGIPGWANV